MNRPGSGADRCPLCGQPNGCQADSRPRDCWCHQVQVPQALLDRVPPGLRGTACICRDCILSFNARPAGV